MALLVRNYFPELCLGVDAVHIDVDGCHVVEVGRCQDYVGFCISAR